MAIGLNSNELHFILLYCLHLKLFMGFEQHLVGYEMAAKDFPFGADGAYLQ